MLLGTPRRLDDDRPITFTTIPKRGGGTRVLARLGSGDERRYRAAVARVAVRAEESLRSAVVAERATITALPDRTGVAFTVEDFRSAWKRFRSEARRLSRSRPGPVVVADVRAFFASLTPTVVGEALLRMGCDPADVGSVLRLLERFGEKGVPGLPVGPDPSAILANAVLAPVDEAIASIGARHLRWVDDFVIFPSRSRDGFEMLDRMSDALDALGLELAPGKCGVNELGNTGLGRSPRETRNGPSALPPA